MAAVTDIAPSRRMGRRLLANRKALIASGLLLAVLMFLCLYPVLMLLYGSFFSERPGVEGYMTLDGYRNVLNARNMEILWTTIVISVLKTAISLGIAIMLAWIIARTDTPWRRSLEVLVTLPFFIPGILTATAWAMLANPQVGPINQAWMWLTGSETPLVNIYSFWGVIWHMCQGSTTFLFIFLVEAFRQMDPALEDASRMSGASPSTTARRITLFLMAPMITSCFILSFIRGMEAFDSALIFGYPADVVVVTTQIYFLLNQSVVPDYQSASALSFVMLLVMTGLILAQQFLLRGRSFQTVTGKGFTPRTIRLGRWRWLTFAICMLFFILTVALPVLQLLISSFYKYFGFYDPALLTLDNYRSVFTSSNVIQSFKNTMILAFFGATLTMTLGSCIAYVTTRTSFPARRAIELLAWLPWMMPGIVLGVGYLWAFAFLPQWIPIYGTIWALMLAYIALSTPVSVRVMSASFQQLSRDLEECSRVSGAGWSTTMRRVVVALVFPSFFAGWLLAFVSIMRELSVSVLLYSAGSEVLSVTILNLWTDGRVGEVSVIGLMMMVLVVILRVAQNLFTRRDLRAIN